MVESAIVVVRGLLFCGVGGVFNYAKNFICRICLTFAVIGIMFYLKNDESIYQ